MMDQRQPFVNVFAISHPLWAIVQDIQDVRSAARIEAIQTVTFVDDIGNVEIQTYYFMPTKPTGLIGFSRTMWKGRLIRKKKPKLKSIIRSLVWFF